MTPLFVASSGTGIGKTLVAAALTWQLRRAGRRVRAIKPVISGYTGETAAESDTAVLLASLETPWSPDAVAAVSPWRFAAPLSPDMAAAREDRVLDFDALVAFCRDCASESGDVLLIEGVGGVMAPLTVQETVLDWMAALEAPALLVVGSYLGTISHTLTALLAVRGRDIPLAGIVISESKTSPVPVAETRGTIRRFAGNLPILALPRIAGPDPWRRAPNLTGFVPS